MASDDKDKEFLFHARKLFQRIDLILRQSVCQRKTLESFERGNTEVSVVQSHLKS